LAKYSDRPRQTLIANTPKTSRIATTITTTTIATKPYVLQMSEQHTTNGVPSGKEKSEIIAQANNTLKATTGPNYDVRQKLALTCRILAHYGHGGTLAGQVTARGEEPGTMWTQPISRGMEEITAADYLLVNEKLEVLHGNGIPNPANRFHLHVYSKRPDISSIVHTHSHHVSALAMTGVPLHVAHMDVMCFYDDVAHLTRWPGVPFGDEEGIIISEALGSKNAILLAHHGHLVVGKSVEQSLYRAVWMEHAAKLQLLAMSAGVGLKEVEPKLGIEARNWRISDGPVHMYFNYWTRNVLRLSQQVPQLPHETPDFLKHETVALYSFHNLNSNNQNDEYL